MNQFVDHIPVKIAYIGGGSLNWAQTLMSDLAFDRHLTATVSLYDLDIEAAKRNVLIGERFAELSQGTPAEYEVAPTLAEALESADIVVVSILPGGFEEMAHDIEIPARYGIPQAVGDTVGPGGFLRAMRAVPMMMKIGRAIEKHAPEAFVCNLTNPMSILTGALYAAFPAIKCWGECHEVTKIRRMIAHIARLSDKSSHWSHRDVKVNVLGINHFTFVDQISLDGRDMRPALHDFIVEHRNRGWAQTEPGKDAEHGRYFGSRNLVGFDLYFRFGIPAAAGDRHLAEFMPAADYLEDPAWWGFALTPVEYRVRDKQRKETRAISVAAGHGEVYLKPVEEAILDQIVALSGVRDFESNVNLPNTGQLQGFPANAIVETNARFTKGAITPVDAGRLPPELEPIVTDHAIRQSATLDAIIAEDREALIRLFQMEPLVATLPHEDSRALFEEMTKATEQWLPHSLRSAA